jgi:hypothetical protein
MYKLIPWSQELDLADFYATAAARGFENNSNQSVLVDCFGEYLRSQVWILYQDDKAIGSVAAHSLPLLGPSAYRICARTCSFAEARPSHGLITVKRLIVEHQNLTAQFFIPACIDWCGEDSDMYISSHASEVGTQRSVHKIYCPTLVKSGALDRNGDYEYRSHVQTFWKLNVPVFKKQLNSNYRWI